MSETMTQAPAATELFIDFDDELPTAAPVEAEGATEPAVEAEAEAEAEEVPDFELDGEPTEAAVAHQGGFVVTDRAGVEWVLEKQFGYQLEIDALRFKAAQQIETIQANLERQCRPFQREIDSLEWRFGRQVRAVCAALIAGLKKGKSVAFTYGSASSKKQPESIKLESSQALAYVQSKKLTALIREKPAVVPPPELQAKEFKAWVKEQLAEVHQEVLEKQGGDFDVADSAKALYLQLEFPFVTIEPETEKLTVELGAK